jgi:putative nucleotidyltransferase with HDIG domain
VYVGCLFVGSLGLAAALATTGHRVEFKWALLILALCGAVAERSSVRLTTATDVSVSLVPILFAAVVFGPLTAMVVAAVAMIGDFRPPFTRWGIYTLSSSLTSGVTGVAAAAALGLCGNVFAGVVLATFVGAVTHQVLELTVAATVAIVRRVEGRARVIRALIPTTLAGIPLYAPLVALLVYVYLEISVWTLPLFLVPALAAQRLLVLYQGQIQLTDELVSANTRLERANLSFATALVATLDARDRYTAGHSAAVAIYARDIAARMGLTPDEQNLVHLCGLVHDIGKIGLSPGLLEKPGALSLDERREMEQHSVIGERILTKVEDYAEVAKIVRHHHERVDGNGYPDNLINDEIPLLSRIICVADAYNAMTSDRPYRDAMPSRVARLRLAQAVQSQFDTSVVTAFEAILASAHEDYRLAKRSDFMLDEQELEHSELRVLDAA